MKQTRESFEDEEFVNSVWRKLEQRSWLASERNSCLVTRAAFYSVVLACLQSLPNEKPPSMLLQLRKRNLGLFERCVMYYVKQCQLRAESESESV